MGVKGIFALVMSSSLLAGCAGSPVGDALAGPEKLAAQDDAYCQSIGAAKGTPQYTDCRLRVTQMRETKHNAARSAAMSGGPVVCNRVGNTTICN
jgi:hypothetical protein